MTNKDKFLRDGVNIDEFTFKFDEWHIKNSDVKGYGEALFRFLQEQVQPTLTEDERVILRNIDKDYEIIIREKGELVVYEHTREDSAFCVLPINKALFQFIKERRRI